jgi:sigma-B regulation protein RsbU (phosphoserine phosphatase)
MAIPLFDGGVALNMVIFLSPEPADFAREQLPEMVWMSNLFGRATHNLVLSREVQRAFDAVDDELRSVAAMQQSLLPERLPRSEHFELATHYRTSRRAGGDYYDFFPLSDGRLGILIADVSGHGTPAAVLMAITQTIAQLNDTLHGEPGAFLQRVNETLARRYVQDTGRFVTAFYAIFDPQLRELTYASAGHPSPRVKSIGADRGVRCLAKPTGLPLGIAAEETYATATEPLAPGDRVVFYTDGITEAFNEAGEMFGTERLDAAIAGCQDARCLVESVTAALKGFVGDHAPGDDQTLVVVHVT